MSYSLDMVRREWDEQESRRRRELRAARRLLAQSTLPQSVDDDLENKVSIDGDYIESRWVQETFNDYLLVTANGNITNGGDAWKIPFTVGPAGVTFGPEVRVQIEYVEKPQLTATQQLILAAGGEIEEDIVYLAGRKHVGAYARTAKSGKVVRVKAYWRTSLARDLKMGDIVRDAFGRERTVKEVNGNVVKFQDGGLGTGSFQVKPADPSGKTAARAASALPGHRPGAPEPSTTKAGHTSTFSTGPSGNTSPMQSDLIKAPEGSTLKYGGKIWRKKGKDWWASVTDSRTSEEFALAGAKPGSAELRSHGGEALAKNPLYKATADSQGSKTPFEPAKSAPASKLLSDLGGKPQSGKEIIARGQDSTPGPWHAASGSALRKGDVVRHPSEDRWVTIASVKETGGKYEYTTEDGKTFGSGARTRFQVKNKVAKGSGNSQVDLVEGHIARQRAKNPDIAKNPSVPWYQGGPSPTPGPELGKKVAAEQAARRAAADKAFNEQNPKGKLGPVPGKKPLDPKGDVLAHYKSGNGMYNSKGVDDFGKEALSLMSDAELKKAMDFKQAEKRLLGKGIVRGGSSPFADIGYIQNEMARRASTSTAAAAQPSSVANMSTQSLTSSLGALSKLSSPEAKARVAEIKAELEKRKKAGRG